MIHCPRLTITGLGGDTGKTAVSVGLCRVWEKRGRRVVSFKKGPDYIDMGWLSRASRHPSYNIDLFLMSREQVLSSFGLHANEADIAVIEGNRGLYDGMDIEGSVSTAEMAKLLKSPVILIVDCTKVTRTVAALVLGCQKFDEEVSIKGVILNKLARPRHESVIRQSVERYCGIPVVGAIPKLKDIAFPGRHLGLLPPQEHPAVEEAIEYSAQVVEKHVNLDLLWKISSAAPHLDFCPEMRPEIACEEITIGIVRDSAFQFYYQENLDALRRAGARLVEFSALKDDLPSSLDALYIGGGFPETHASLLSENVGLRRAIKKAADEGLPIYAECGGLMYLSEELVLEGKKYPMVGIFPVSVGVSKKPQGHGYTIAQVENTNPFFEAGQILHGHEFHYSYVMDMAESSDFSYAFHMVKGQGIKDKKDGLCFRNVLATYTHLHSSGTSGWAYALANMAAVYKKTSLSVD
jgi:cobyrinic acid a,c-diamide synthase